MKHRLNFAKHIININLEFYQIKFILFFLYNDDDVNSMNWNWIAMTNLIFY